MKIFEVGGCVRDEILGQKSKDVDFSVVLDELDLRLIANTEKGTNITIDPFRYMVNHLQNIGGFKIFVETPQFLVVRAQFPKGHPNAGLTADFVLARKEDDYTDGRRPDKVIPGTLEDDLARRDFTMNAVAKDEDGTLIDPHGGRADIEAKIIRAVGNPEDRFREDPLRILRALRFSVTKGFTIEAETFRAAMDLKPLILPTVKSERITDEFKKMFKFNTLDAVHTMNEFGLWNMAVEAGIRFAPTLGAIK